MALAEVTELLPLAAATADALSRLIARTKAVGYRAPTADPAAPASAAPVDIATVPNKKDPRRTVGWAVPTADAPAAALAPLPVEEPAPAPPPPRPISAVIAAIEGDDEAAAAAALTEAVNRADEALPVVAVRFPGRLRVDRYRVSGRALRPGQYGNLLELVVQPGRAGRRAACSSG
jgi:hypothetical protein